MAARPAHRFRTVGGLEVAEWTGLVGAGLRAAVTTRHGGVSGGPYTSLNLGLHVGDEAAAVLENRERAVATVGGSLDDLVTANQVHGRMVATVTRADRGRGAWSATEAVADADALVTDEPGVVLMILVADCVPILLFDPERRVLGCVHAGWRGTCLRAADAAIDAMVAQGARRDAVVAGIGPAIAPDAYEVGEEVATALRDALGGGGSAGGAGGGSLLRPGARDRWHLDLAGANRRFLIEAGVRPERIHPMTVPTGPAGPFFSDRAQRPCGRFGLLARLEEARAGRALGGLG